MYQDEDKSLEQEEVTVTLTIDEAMHVVTVLLAAMSVAPIESATVIAEVLSKVGTSNPYVGMGTLMLMAAIAEGGMPPHLAPIPMGMDFNLN